MRLSKADRVVVPGLLAGSSRRTTMRNPKRPYVHHCSRRIVVERRRRAPRPPERSLRLGRRRRHLPHHAGHGRRRGCARRPDPAASEGVRLGHGDDLIGPGRALRAVRIDGAFRGPADEPLRPAPHRAPGASPHRRGVAHLPLHERGLAAGHALGRRRRHRHGAYRPGARRHHRDPLVLAVARPRRRSPHRQFGHRPTHRSPRSSLPSPSISAGVQHSW